MEACISLRVCVCVCVRQEYEQQAVNQRSAEPTCCCYRAAHCHRVHPTLRSAPRV
uniref:Uncharacterized protein n=1 Tax=Anguilla anguilla TaxID=7936 RepID=A0A0E9XIU3_ANGAN